MASQYKTPGVYVVEKDAFPTSVVQVPTSIPVFVGHTEKAETANQDLTGTPTRISSMMDFTAVFGGPPMPKLTVTAGTPTRVAVDGGNKYILHAAMLLYFNNGGGPCWVISVGDYNTNFNPSAFQEPFTKRTGSLEKTAEPTIVCIPEAIRLSAADWADVTNAALDHCGRLMSRVMLVDVFDGDQPRDNNAKTDVITGTDSGLRNKIETDALSYGAAYYPWVNTSILSMGDIGLDRFTPASLKILGNLLKTEGEATGNNKLTELATYLTGPPSTNTDNKDDKAPAAAPAPSMTQTQAHKAAISLSPAYRAVMENGLRQLNLLPPSAAMAGVYARTDNNVGVFKAPANTGLRSVISPACSISDEEQEDLNIPLDGKAVNAIRSFLGRGVLVWGARTLDGNSQDWRYINVRRTLIMLEQSIKYAAEPYVFAPNTASTWVTVSNVISNFLDNQWKAGALAGATAPEAYTVSVGLGSTMTSRDVLDGYIKIVVRVAIVRPAEFIELTFQQKMQTS